MPDEKKQLATNDNWEMPGLGCTIPNPSKTKDQLYYVNMGEDTDHVKGDVVDYPDDVYNSIGMATMDMFDTLTKKIKYTPEKMNVVSEDYLMFQTQNIVNEIVNVLNANIGYIFCTGIKQGIEDCINFEKMKDFQNVISSTRITHPINYVNICQISPSINQIYNNKSDGYYDHLLPISPFLVQSIVSTKYHEFINMILYEYDMLDLTKFVVKYGIDKNQLKAKNVPTSLLYQICYGDLLTLANLDLTKIVEMASVNIAISEIKLIDIITYFG